MANKLVVAGVIGRHVGLGELPNGSIAGTWFGRNKNPTDSHAGLVWVRPGELNGHWPHGHVISSEEDGPGGVDTLLTFIHQLQIWQQVVMVIKDEESTLFHGLH